MIAGNILGLINSCLTVLGVITTCLAVVMVADYFIVKNRSEETAAEAVNWAGVITVVLGSFLAMSLQKIFPIAFITSTVISLILYPVLRKYVLKPQKGYVDSILKSEKM